MGRKKKEEIIEKVEETKNVEIKTEKVQKVKTKKVENKETKIRKTKVAEPKKTIKDEFESDLEKITKIGEAIKLHKNVKQAVLKEKVDKNYLTYIENSIEDKLFNDAKFNKINSKVLLEFICPELTEIENFKVKNLEIKDIGRHFEEKDEYIDKICTYNGNFVCLFGVKEKDEENAMKYEARKFIRQDMLEAVCKKLKEGQKIQIEQYDEYYVVIDEESLKVFSERKVVSLVKIEETIFDKIKAKISSFCTNLFTKKTYLPNVELIYDSNPNRLKDFKNTSKIEAKNRMKALLRKEREITRVANS